MFVLLAGTACVALQAEANGFPPESRMESRQGREGQPDVIAHRPVVKGTHFKCLQVESYPKSVEAVAACILRFESGLRTKLDFGQSTAAPEAGEVHLECSGDKPTRCTVGLY